MLDDITLLMPTGVDHWYVSPPEAVKVTLPPEQIVVAPDGVIVAVGTGINVKSNVSFTPEQPFKVGVTMTRDV